MGCIGIITKLNQIHKEVSKLKEEPPLVKKAKRVPSQPSNENVVGGR